MRIPPEVQAAFEKAVELLFRLARESRCPQTMVGYCVEASCVMYRHLTRAGYKAILVRRMTEFGGHWTVKYNGVEYDPTVGWWVDVPENNKSVRRNIPPRKLFVVSNRPYGGAKAPYTRWPIVETSETHPEMVEFCKEFDRLWNF